jgi:ATP-dependent Zn protease
LQPHPHTVHAGTGFAEKVQRLVVNSYDSARTILVQNLHILHKVAQALLEKETLDGIEFERIVSTMNPVYPAPTSNVA